MWSARTYLPKPRKTILGAPAGIAGIIASPENAPVAFLREGPPQRVGHALLVFGGEPGVEGKRKRAGARSLGCRTQPLPSAEPVAVIRLEVDRGQVWLGGDALLGETGDHRVPVYLFGEEDDVDEPGAAVVPPFGGGGSPP